MMNIFSEYANELPPFKHYLQLIFKNSRMMVKNRTTGMQVSYLSMEKRNMLNPNKNTNIERTARMIDIVSVGMSIMNKYLIDIRKST